MSEEHQVIRVAVLGARGRVGSEVCRTVEAAEGLELVATVDVGDELDVLVAAQAEVVVDFTTPDAAPANVRWCVTRGINVVVGTSGFSEAKLAEIRALLNQHQGIGVIVVPNFAIGAVLMMEFSAMAARFFQSVEIVESHHPGKLDAPSGTAVRTAELVAAARSAAGLPAMPDATADERQGARGAEVEGVHVHSVRAAGLVAHQEVLFGTVGETLTIRHDSLDRKSFMPGVLLAVRAVGGMPGLTVGLGTLLGFDS
ncbi:MAG: 4-hydroxy-tetrahydrodipicolinate reductase [Micromonosporaceae bacterium]|nr:4-hydroxy-tetrahydrodipicolinate reductase [Micromonosporaceae bacterium]